MLLLMHVFLQLVKRCYSRTLANKIISKINSKKVQLNFWNFDIKPIFIAYSDASFENLSHGAT